jgi:hypothetical protein
MGPRAGLDDAERRKKNWANRDTNSEPSAVQLIASQYTD